VFADSEAMLALIGSALVPDPTLWLGVWLAPLSELFVPYWNQN
jgi:hypothetical protein